MGNEVNVNNPTTPSYNGGTDSAADQKYKADLKGKSPEDLQKMLADPNISLEQMMAIIEQLAKLESKELDKAKAEDPAAAEEQDELQKLLQKLKDGTISDKEIQDLAQMLGVDPAMLEKAKGKGEDYDPTKNQEIED